MEKCDRCYQQYVQILREELLPAMGCTEPVVVPNTGGLKGLPAAAAAGVAAGDAGAELQVLASITPEQIKTIGEFLERTPIEVRHADTPHIFDIAVSVFSGAESAYVRITDFHTNIVCIRRDSETLLEKKDGGGGGEASLTDRSCMTVEKIVDFVTNNYGANIGKTLLRGHENDINYKLRAWAAAGSDARMNGCEMPVVINSGSGNQGITTSVPVIVYARETDASEEQLLRALCVSNLVTIHLKTGIGRLSAYCGAVSAGAGAASGIAYLQGGRFEVIAHTIVNTVAVTSGIVCDGAKASCAAKIAAAVDAGLLGLAMYRGGNQFFGGDGIVKKGVERTIEIVGKLASRGMVETDKEIIRLMMEN